MYCIGNEITDTGRSYAPGITWKLCNAIHQVDKTRPITIANNAPMSIIASEMEKMETQKNGEIGSVQINELLTAHPELQKSFERGAFGADKLEAIVGKVFDEVDIAGHNYANDFYEGIHKIRPDRILLSTETFPSRMATNWKDVKEKDYVIGDFHWAAWDYLGEAGVGVPTYGTKEASFTKPYPCLTASCGSFDLIGIPEAAAYYTAIIWGEYKKPYIGVRPVNHSGEEYTIGQWRLTDAMNCWTWKGCEGKEAEVIIYSIGKEIELYINGSSIGRKKLVDCKAEYNTCYKPGTIEAVSYNENGTEIGRTQLQTAEDKVCLVITSEDNEVKADIDEIFYVIISLTDDKGILQQMLDKKIAVTVEGEGELIALGSGCPETAEKFSAGTYTSWHGYVLGAIRCSGKSGNIKVTATAEGCETVSVKVQAREKISRGVVL